MIFARETWTTNADNKLTTISREYKERWVVNSVIVHIRIIYLFIIIIIIIEQMRIPIVRKKERGFRVYPMH